jgi:hypothetical protein
LAILPWSKTVYVISNFHEARAAPALLLRPLVVADGFHGFGAAANGAVRHLRIGMGLPAAIVTHAATNNVVSISGFAPGTIVVKTEARSLY